MIIREGSNLLTKAASKMRKDKQQRKKTKDQLDLLSGSIEPDGRTIGGTEVYFDSGVELSSRLENQRTLTANLLTKIVDYENLNRAYKQVKCNKGSSGVDKMEIEEFSDWLRENLKDLRTSILTEEYEVSAVRKVEIPKPTGGTRVLGIPTVIDRFIQQAIHQKLNRYYDPHFSQHSYGFRPGKDARQAILQATQYIQEGKDWVVDIDLEKFFDKINHDRLMQRLSKGIGDKRLLSLIKAYLKAGLMEGGVVEQRISGPPQGGPLSPLLSNIVHSRNGSFPKTITTENVGEVILNIPRDRNGLFEPYIIPKGQTISSNIEDAIIGMYGRGMTTSDVRKQVLEIYGLEISETTVSNITESIMLSAREWQQRPLESVYFTVWMDGIMLKVREEGKVINKCVYIVIGLKADGMKEVLGYWIEKTESAAFWMSVLTDLKTRGVEDVLILPVLTI